MGILTEVNQKAKELEELKQVAIKKIVSECKKFENEKIKFISKKGPRVFILNFKDLEDNWCPLYYDFEYQFKCILYIFKHTNPDNLINKWEQIKKDGICQVLPDAYTKSELDFIVHDKQAKEDFYSSSLVKISLNPKVINFLDSILLNQKEMR